MTKANYTVSALASLYVKATVNALSEAFDQKQLSRSQRLLKLWKRTVITSFRIARNVDYDSPSAKAKRELDRAARVRAQDPKPKRTRFEK